MTLNKFLSDNNIQLYRVEKLYLGIQIKKKAKENKIWYKKVMVEEDNMTFWVIDYPDEWLSDNAPDIIIEFMKGLNK